MNEMVTNFLREKYIDSFQKLHVLLFMHQYPYRVKNCQQLAAELYIGETPLLEQTLHELQQIGLIYNEAGRCSLSEEPEVKASLQELALIFADPVARQRLLNKLKKLHQAPGLY
jgi:hypothetical protein